MVFLNHGAFFLGLLGFVAFNLFGSRFGLLHGLGFGFTHRFGHNGLCCDVGSRFGRDFSFDDGSFLDHRFDNRSLLDLRGSSCSSGGFAGQALLTTALARVIGGSAGSVGRNGRGGFFGGRRSSCRGFFGSGRRFCLGLFDQLGDGFDHGFSSRGRRFFRNGRLGSHHFNGFVGGFDPLRTPVRGGWAAA